MSENCSKIHKLFNRFPKFSFPFNEQEIPENGIYVLFEKGEFAHNTDRIVRIGTHTGKNQLRSRLQQHFINENKDRSIFRKHIGRALLSKENDPFLKKWEIDLTTKKSKEKFSSSIDFGKQTEIEKKVTKYIQENFSFVVIPIEDKEKRLKIESKLISTISLCKECKPSDKWLGLHSPNEKYQTQKVYNNCLKIRKIGLWLVNELGKEALSNKDIEELKTINN